MEKNNELSLENLEEQLYLMKIKLIELDALLIVTDNLLKNIIKNKVG